MRKAIKQWLSVGLLVMVVCLFAASQCNTNVNVVQPEPDVVPTTDDLIPLFIGNSWTYNFRILSALFPRAAIGTLMLTVVGQPNLDVFSFEVQFLSGLEDTGDTELAFVRETDTEYRFTGFGIPEEDETVIILVVARVGDMYTGAPFLQFLLAETTGNPVVNDLAAEVTDDPDFSVPDGLFAGRGFQGREMPSFVVEYEDLNSPGDLWTEVFVPGVGVVQSTAEVGGNSVTYELTGFALN